MSSGPLATPGRPALPGPRPAVRLAAAAVASLAALGVGVLIVVAPLAAAAAVALLVPLGLLGLGARAERLFGGALLWLLVGYLFLGRGFAYLGYPPLFVGEVVFCLALVSVLVTAARTRLTPLHGVVLAFMAWGLARTLPYLERDGIHALRDGALWGYALFALAVSTMLTPSRIGQAVAAYRLVLPWFLLWVPVAGILGLALTGALPRWPGSGVPVLVFKGDMGVHLAGAAAFVLVGLYALGSPRRRAREGLLWLPWFAGFAVVAAHTRGGLVAIAGGVTLAFMLLASTERRMRFLAVTAAAVTVLAVWDPSISTGRTRTISVGQLGLNAVSIFQSTGSSSLEGSKGYRLEWWSTIVGYTFRGEHFWTGKGFGINLADDDGFRVGSDGSLRAPHNTHMTVLARMGVPGLAFWIVLQAWFAAALLRALRRARRAGAVFWAGVNVWLLVYWVAAMLNTAFDPYLEGPQGSIWFWSLFGLGLAALRFQRTSLAAPEEAR